MRLTWPQPRLRTVAALVAATFAYAMILFPVRADPRRAMTDKEQAYALIGSHFNANAVDRDIARRIRSGK